MVPVIDRSGICDLTRDLLLADTKILYGTDKLVQDIHSDPVKYLNPKVDNRNPFQIFLFCEDKQKVGYGMQNAIEQYSVSYRIAGIFVDQDAVYDRIDDIDKRINALIDAQMFSGEQFTSFYSDTKTRIIDGAYDNSGLTIELHSGKVAVECAGAITFMTINYS